MQQNTGAFIPFYNIFYRHGGGRRRIKIIMKIYVYAISKNEEKFACRWLKSMAEADGIFVLDTGSDDDTVKLLQEGGATVKQAAIEPWRFDSARNAALDMVPDEDCLCVSTDLDEVFLPGWRAKLEEAAVRTRANLLSCYYVWSVMPDGSDGISFYIKKIHARRGFAWKGIVHEVVTPSDGTVLSEAIAEGVKLVHRPDGSKSRAQYLPLLEKATREEPQNDRNSFYLGREYYFRAMYKEAEKELLRHLSLPAATWAEERSASRRFLAKSQVMLGKKQAARQNFIMGVGEYPYSREPWIALGEFLYSDEDWQGAIWAMQNALAIPRPSSSYLNDPASFSSYPYDILSVAYFKTGDTLSALECADAALFLSPGDARISANAEFFRDFLRKNRAL